MALIANALVAAGVCILAAALVPLLKILSLVPPGRLRAAWYLLEALIATFMAGYLAYLVFLPHPVAAPADLVVPAVFFLGACFVWLVTALSLKTSLDVRRVAFLAKESITDPLTGLYNRRFLDRMLRRELARAERHRLPLTVLLLDLDLFKRINDTRGHRVGDLVLKAFAELLLRTVRESDIVCRFGGEEFVVIAPETDAAVGAALSERLRNTVENSVLLEASPEDGHSEVRVTASIGAASLSPGMPNAQALLDAADEALYRAKRMGRNRSLSAAGAQLVARAPGNEIA